METDTSNIALISQHYLHLQYSCLEVFAILKFEFELKLDIEGQQKKKRTHV